MREKTISTEMKFYAVRTMSNRENKVMERFLKEIQILGLGSLVGRTIIPIEKIFCLKNSKKTIKERVLYPGYIFIETIAIGEIERVLKSIEGTSGLVRTRDGKIDSMKQREVESMLKNQEETSEKEFKDVFIVGEEVEITDGPFVSFKGKIHKLDEDKQKMTVNVSIFGRPTPVDLTYEQVRK